MRAHLHSIRSKLIILVSYARTYRHNLRKLKRNNMQTTVREEKKISSNWLSQPRLLVGRRTSHHRARSDSETNVCRADEPAVRIITATNSAAQSAGQCVWVGILTRTFHCGVWLVYIFRVFESYMHCWVYRSVFLLLLFCSFLFFFLENTWIHLSRLLFSSLIWWFLWLSLAVIVICCCLPAVVAGISLLDTNCTIELKLHYLFRFPMKSQVGRKNKVNGVNSTSFLGSATLLSLYCSNKFSNDKHVCAWLTSSRANELSRIRTAQVRAENVIIGCRVSICRLPPHIVFSAKSIGIRRAKWNYTMGNCEAAVYVCLMMTLTSPSNYLNFCFCFLSHFSETNSSAPTMKIPNEDDNLNVLFSLRILHHFSFASAHMTCNGNQSSGLRLVRNDEN